MEHFQAIVGFDYISVIFIVPKGYLFYTCIYKKGQFSYNVKHDMI